MVDPCSDSGSDDALPRILEALLLSAEQPLSLDTLLRILGEPLAVGRQDLRRALLALGERLHATSATELREVASGWRIQVRDEYAAWVTKLWVEKPARMSRAMLETLAIIVYRQPVTRGEIEDIRGVAVSGNILRALVERGWVREVGVRETPGRPALFGTTPQLLDDLNLKSLDQLPALPDIRDIDQLDAALARLADAGAAAEDAVAPAQEASAGAAAGASVH
jgi:segregation and condensation protein B